MFPKLEDQVRRLEELRALFKTKELSLAEGRKLAADLYVSGALQPELLLNYDEALIVELESRSNKPINRRTVK